MLLVALLIALPGSLMASTALSLPVRGVSAIDVRPCRAEPRSILCSHTTNAVGLDGIVPPTRDLLAMDTTADTQPTVARCPHHAAGAPRGLRAAAEAEHCGLRAEHQRVAAGPAVRARCWGP